MRFLADELANFLRDGLRGARYVVRHGTRLGQDAVAFAPGGPEVVRFADSMLTATERTAAALLLRQDRDFEHPTSVRDVFGAFMTEPESANRRRLFIRLQYRLIEAVLRRLGVENVFLSEHEIAAAYGILRRRHRRLLAARGGSPLRFWVAAAVTLGARQPVREIDLPRQVDPRTVLLERAPSPYCLLVVALTGAMLTKGDAVGDERLDDYIDSAIAVVTARFDEFVGQFVQPDAVDRLTDSFAAMLPLLP